VCSSDLEEQLAQVRAKRSLTERQIAAFRKAQADLTTIYNDRWATEPERFTALVNEVKRLEQASQLIGRSHGFQKSEKDAKQATGLGTDVVVITFSVQGTYQQVRRLINLLELSDQFVIIDAISLSGGGEAASIVGGEGAPPPRGPVSASPAPSNGPLTLSLRLKTIFRSTLPPTAAARANQQL